MSMKKDARLVELIVRVGLHGNLAKVIVYLSKTKRAKAKEIERYADLRQLEISLTIKSPLEN